MDELTKEFLAESAEGLDRMEQCLTALETRPHDRDLLDEIFRAVHTIKGSTGFLGLQRLEALAHAGENLLGSLRDGLVPANKRVISGLLQLLDGLKAILELIESTGREGIRASDEDGALLALLVDLNKQERVAGNADRLQVMVLPEKAQLLPAPREEVSGKAERLTDKPGSPGEKTLRVDVEVLNRMVNLVGELVLTRNQMLQSQPGEMKFLELTRRLDSVTSDLRETVMRARMQPVSHLFGKFPRMVRELAQTCGKSVRIEFSGQETGLDKSLLEAIKDPLAHAVRNAVDHGIEDCAGRVLAGKPLEGVVTMRARQHNGTVVVEVADDGGGISLARVRARAVERHLVSPKRAESMTEREVLQLLFLPGFSTTDTITHVSGRGVGLDVVLANVEQVGGTVELESREGEGTVLRLCVPLTLAIVPALVVRSGGQSFCLPQGTLAELVYVPWGEAAAAVERIGQAELYRLRETLLPLVRLDRLLAIEDDNSTRSEHGFYLAVLETEGRNFGLMVDELMAPEEIVVKPLSAVLREIGLFSGVTVLGNGRLALILDVSACAVRAGVRLHAEEEKLRMLPEIQEKSASKSFLVFEDKAAGPTTERMALPLAVVERIETIAVRDVEYAGGKPLLRYRGQLLALEDAGRLLPELKAEAYATVLICRGDSKRQGGQKRIGIVVRKVVDVACGELMASDMRVSDKHLALVNDQLAVVHEAFTLHGQMEEVA